MTRKAVPPAPTPADMPGDPKASPAPQQDQVRDAGPTQTPSFEDQLAELEALVDTLERGDLSLEQSLAAFERGVLLTRSCQQALDAAEQKVRILTSASDGAQPEPYVHD